MGYRNVFISSPARLSFKNHNFVVQTDNDSREIPLEDINSVLIESTQVNISSYLLQKLAGNGVCTFVCDEKHMPSAVLIPFNSHSRRLKVLESQLNIKKPLEKKIWQDIVRQKIKNQAKVLEVTENGGHEELLALSSHVLSGDSTNMEAVAARKYFINLFGGSFSRSADNLINASLNYAYAVFRGLIARTLTVYGFEPAIGLFHSNQLNAFNLADDIIEVFRPVADLFVAQNIFDSNDSLTPEVKHGLYNLVNANVISNGEKHSLSYAVERIIKSLSTILEENSGNITLCEVMSLEMHEYE